MKAHVEQCEWRIVQCPHCSQSMPFRALAEHTDGSACFARDASSGVPIPYKRYRINAADISDKEVAQLFGMLDADGSGHVEVDELCEFMRRGPELTTATLDRLHDKMYQCASTAEGLDCEFLFRRLDRDGQGTLDVNELKRGVRRERPNPGEVGRGLRNPTGGRGARARAPSRGKGIDER